MEKTKRSASAIDDRGEHDLFSRQQDRNGLPNGAFGGQVPRGNNVVDHGNLMQFQENDQGTRQQPVHHQMIYSFDQVDQALLKYNELFVQKKEKAAHKEEDTSSVLNAMDKSGSAVTEELAAHSQDDVSQKVLEQSPSALSIHDKDPYSSRQSPSNDELEIGYFHLLNCDIKSTEDMIRYKYLEKTQDIVQNHY
jgi:hypothetical protein